MSGFHASHSVGPAFSKRRSRIWVLGNSPRAVTKSVRLTRGNPAPDHLAAVLSWRTHVAGKDQCAAGTRAPHEKSSSPARLSALSMRFSGTSSGAVLVSALAGSVEILLLGVGCRASAPPINECQNWPDRGRPFGSGTLRPQ
jgi:hypothetical protein